MDTALIRQYRCVTCSFTSNVFPEIIDHNIINHPEYELKIKVYLSDKKTLHTNNFGIVPGKLLNNGYYIHSNKGKDTIKVGKISSLSEGKNIFDNHNFKIKSLISKKQKLSTSTPKKSSMAVATKDDSTDDSDNEMEVDSFQDVDEIDQNLSTELLNLSISEGDSHDL